MLQAVGVFLGLVAAAAFPGDQIVIDGASDAGEARPVTGYLHGFSDRADADMEAVRALKPRGFRFTGETMMRICDELDAEATVVVSSYFSREKGGREKALPWEDWEEWEQFVADLYDMIHREITVPAVFWDIWNEPDSNWYFPGTREQYMETVARAHKVLKAKDPNAIVAGPCWSPYTPKLGGLAEFLAELDQKWNVRFDAIIWHENGPPDPHEFPYHVKEFRNDTHRLIGPDYSPPIQINEYEPSLLHLIPGRQVCWLSYFEQEGVTCTGRACWPVYTGTPPEIEIFSDCGNGLNGMFMPDDNRTKQALYWAYKAYADQTGRRLKMESDNPAVRAIASKDDAEKVVRVLIGRYRYANAADITIENYPFDAPNGVAVAVQYLPNQNETYKTFAKAIPVPEEPEAITQVVALENGAIKTTLKDFLDGDVYILTCRAATTAD